MVANSTPGKNEYMLDLLRKNSLLIEDKLHRINRHSLYYTIFITMLIN